MEKASRVTGPVPPNDPSPYEPPIGRQIGPGVDSYPIDRERLGSLSLRDGPYELRYASNRADLETVLRLRYEVFNVELGEGLAVSEATGLDEDEFDPVCHHLMVTEVKSGRTIGTYRLQTAEMAAANRGFYTAREFALDELPSEILEQGIELGRACIARDHRNRRPLFLLWRGLAHYLQIQGKRYLFGCSSLTSQDPSEGAALLEELRRRDRVENRWFASVRDPFRFDGEIRRMPPPEIPTLFKTYLRYGAKVCGGPAIDREFKTIDFLAVLDSAALDARTVSIFFGGLR